MQSYNIDEGLYCEAQTDLRVSDVIMSTQYGTSYTCCISCAGRLRRRGGGQGRVFRGMALNGSPTRGLDPSRIDYLVLNYTEPDHTGAVREPA